jgi:hypothetical protein
LDFRVTEFSEVRLAMAEWSEMEAEQKHDGHTKLELSRGGPRHGYR